MSIGSCNGSVTGVDADGSGSTSLVVGSLTVNSRYEPTGGADYFGVLSGYHVRIVAVDRGVEKVITDTVIPSGVLEAQPQQDTFAMTAYFPLQRSGSVYRLGFDVLDGSGAPMFSATPVQFRSDEISRDSATVWAPVSYVGPGRNATSVVISPSSLSLVQTSAASVTAIVYAGDSILSRAIVRWTATNDDYVGVPDVAVNPATVSSGKKIGSARLAVSVVGSPVVDTIIVTTLPGVAGLVEVGNPSHTATVGTKLAEPVRVRVTDLTGAPLAGATVTFVPAVGGGVEPAVVTTLEDGTAQTWWTLGPAIGPQSLAVTAMADPKVEGRTISVAATARPKPPSAYATKVIISPRSLSLLEGAHAPLSATVYVGDTVLTGVTVTWKLIDDDVAAFNIGVYDNQNPTTVYAIWHGATRIAVSVAESTVADTIPLTVRPAVSQLIFLGAGQSAPVGTTLPAIIQVRVTGYDGDPVPGATVLFSASDGGIASPSKTITDANGLAETQWTLGMKVGEQTLTGSAAADGQSSSAGGPLHALALPRDPVYPPPPPCTAVSPDEITRVVLWPRVTTVVEGYMAGPINAQAYHCSIAVNDRRYTWRMLDSSTAGFDLWRRDQFVVRGKKVGTTAFIVGVEGYSVADTLSITVLPTIGAIALETGGNQSGAPGSTLPLPMGFRVTNTQGNPLVGAYLEFTPLGEGIASPRTSYTASDGRTQVTWMLDGTVGMQGMRVNAHYFGTSIDDTVTATGTSAPAVVNRVKITTAADSINLGQSTTLLANSYTFSTPEPPSPIDWVSLNPDMLTVSGSGNSATVTALKRGVARVAATVSGTNVSDTIAIKLLPIVKTVWVVYGDWQSTAQYGRPEQMVVQVDGTDGLPVEGATVRWTLDDGRVLGTSLTDAIGRAGTHFGFFYNFETVGIHEIVITASRPGAPAVQTIAHATITPYIPGPTEVTQVVLVSGAGATQSLSSPLDRKLIKLKFLNSDGAPVAGAGVYTYWSFTPYIWVSNHSDASGSVSVDLFGNIPLGAILGPGTVRFEPMHWPPGAVTVPFTYVP